MGQIQVFTMKEEDFTMEYIEFVLKWTTKWKAKDIKGW